MNTDTLARMQTYGGAFARAIAHAYIVADSDNRQRLESAFADLFARYAEDIK
jgi:hypothetical protein